MTQQLGFDLNFLLGIILFVVASICWLIWYLALSLRTKIVDKMEKRLYSYHPRVKEVDGWHLQEKLIDQMRGLFMVIVVPLLVVQLLTVLVVLPMGTPDALLAWQTRLFVTSGLSMFAITWYVFSIEVDDITNRCAHIRERIARDIEYLEAIEKEESFVK